MTPEEALLARVDDYGVLAGADRATREGLLESRLETILATAPRGLPRPTVRGLPVPWISKAEDLGDVDVFRRAVAILLKLCAVCGLPLGQYATIFSRPWDRVTIDGVAVHPDECAGMTLRKCPSIRGLDADGLLITETVRTGDLGAIDAGPEAAESGMPVGYASPHHPSRSA